MSIWNKSNTFLKEDMKQLLHNTVKAPPQPLHTNMSNSMKKLSNRTTIL